MSPKRRIAALGLMLGSSVLPASAIADSRSPPSDADGARLDRALDFYASEQRRSRWTRALGEALEGAVLLPTGIILATRSDPELELVGVGLIVTGSVALLDSSSLLAPGPMERLRAHHRRRKAHGADATAVVETEDEWEYEADRQRRYRPFWAVMNLAFGGVCLTLGTFSLLAQPVFGLSRHVQTTWGSVLVPLGLRAAWDGVSLLGPTDLEQAWEIYQRMRPASDRGVQGGPVFSIAPALGGAAASVRLAF